MKTHGYYPNGRSLCGGAYRHAIEDIVEEAEPFFNRVERVDCKRCWWAISTWAETISAGLQSIWCCRYSHCHNTLTADELRAGQIYCSECRSAGS